MADEKEKRRKTKAANISKWADHDLYPQSRSIDATPAGKPQPPSRLRTDSCAKIICMELRVETLVLRRHTKKISTKITLKNNNSIL